MVHFISKMKTTDWREKKYNTFVKHFGKEYYMACRPGAFLFKACFSQRSFDVSQQGKISYSNQKNRWDMMEHTRRVHED